MNRAFIVGRLVRDPEVRTTPNGKMVTSFTVAVNRFGAPGQKESTDFIPVVTWEKLAENCGNNLSKGQRVLVEGRIQVRSYETKEGQKRTATEIVAQAVEFLDYKQAGKTTEGAPAHDVNQLGSDVADTEEIPF